MSKIDDSEGESDPSFIYQFCKTPGAAFPVKEMWQNCLQRDGRIFVILVLGSSEWWAHDTTFELPFDAGERLDITLDVATKVSAERRAPCYHSGSLPTSRACF